MKYSDLTNKVVQNIVELIKKSGRGLVSYEVDDETSIHDLNNIVENMQKQGLVKNVRQFSDLVEFEPTGKFYINYDL